VLRDRRVLSQHATFRAVVSQECDPN